MSGKKTNDEVYDLYLRRHINLSRAINGEMADVAKKVLASIAYSVKWWKKTGQYQKPDLGWMDGHFIGLHKSYAKAEAKKEAELLSAVLADADISAKTTNTTLDGDWIIYDQTLSEATETLKARVAEIINPQAVQQLSESYQLVDLIAKDARVALAIINAITVTDAIISNTAAEERDALWQANADIIPKLRWVSTLDGRTSSICRALDRKEWATTDKNQPKCPAHFNCRSLKVPVPLGETIVGERPYVTDTRTRNDREADFEAESARTGKSVKSIRQKWKRENIGQVDATTSYDTWLRRQDDAFVKATLPQWQYEEFKRGVKLDKFVTKDARPMTREEYEAS